MFFDRYGLFKYELFEVFDKYFPFDSEMFPFLEGDESAGNL
jgi:hypothetical protein